MASMATMEREMPCVQGAHTTERRKEEENCCFVIIGLRALDLVHVVLSVSIFLHAELCRKPRCHNFYVRREGEKSSRSKAVTWTKLCPVAKSSTEERV